MTPNETLTAKNMKFDLNELILLSDNDHVFFMDMINIFIQTTREGIEHMNRTLQTKEWEKLADHAHKILPPCKHLKAKYLTDLLVKIEKTILETNSYEEIAFLLSEATKEAEEITKELEAIAKK